MEAKQAADTEPTYPNPKMLTDKPKRILLAIESLGPTAWHFSPSNYTNPFVGNSKPLSIVALKVLRPVKQPYCFQSITDYLERYRSFNSTWGKRWTTFSTEWEL
jgi:hypothetical protein